VVRVGGGVERLDMYVPKNHRKFERQLVEYMSRSQETLAWVIDALVRGEKIRRPAIEPSDPMRFTRKNENLVKKVGVSLRNNSRSLSSRGSEHSANQSLNHHVINKSIQNSINANRALRNLAA